MKESVVGSKLSAWEHVWSGNILYGSVWIVSRLE